MTHRYEFVLANNVTGLVNSVCSALSRQSDFDCKGITVTQCTFIPIKTDNIPTYSPKNAFCFCFSSTGNASQIVNFMDMHFGPLLLYSTIYKVD